MSICENIDPDKILALPPTKAWRKVDAYKYCLIEGVPKNSNEYDEEPFVPIELPDSNQVVKYSLPNKGIYVIPYDRPDTILISKETIFGKELKKIVRCRTQKNGTELPFEKRKFRADRIYHTYLTGANPVIAAGQFIWNEQENTMLIDNKSGHYIPPSSVMDYAKCLFEKKGYKTVLREISNSPLHNTVKKNFKPLSYWLSTPVSEWYPEEKKGGKSKKRGKTLKKRRHT